MKIEKVTDEAIIFDDFSKITYWHGQDCCELNWADFLNIEDIARDYDFKLPLDFEFIEESGFRFGNKDGMMFFIPCYSEQNGYYSTDIEILYNDKTVLTGECEFVYA